MARPTTPEPPREAAAGATPAAPRRGVFCHVANGGGSALVAAAGGRDLAVWTFDAAVPVADVLAGATLLREWLDRAAPAGRTGCVP